MRPGLKCLVPAVAASVTLAACGSSSSGTGSSSSSSSASSSSQQSPAAAVVKTASNATIGATVLTNAQGLTLYSLSAERGGKFICTSASCTQVWHPLTPTGGTPTGVASLNTITRPDGAQQVTYKRMPLYTFAQDQHPGDAKGQGFKDVGTWSAVTLSGAAVPVPAPAQTTSTSSGGRYGY
jgi:predicted lipoprotein with Yx(FWY)xxD motif